LTEQLLKIHEAAVSYYAKFDDPPRRAEEIYHRLAIGVDRSELASRWQSGLIAYLASSIRELPEQSQIYLAARLGVELPESLWEEAVDEDWALYAARAATEMAKMGRLLDALTLLSRRRHLYDDPGLQPVVEKVAFDLLRSYATEYEVIRRTQPIDDARTQAMDELVARTASLVLMLPDTHDYPRRLLNLGTDGDRVVALAIAIASPLPDFIELATEIIRHARSPFEQYHALRLAVLTVDQANPIQQANLRRAILEPQGVPIHEGDRARARLKKDLLTKLERRSDSKRKKPKK
jgi:hypothetical protein